MVVVGGRQPDRGRERCHLGRLWVLLRLHCRFVFQASTLHRLNTTGITQPIGSPAFTFVITDPDFAWTDTYAPQLSSVQHRQGIVQLPDLRVNETFSIVLFDVAGEDDLAVEFLGLDWEEADGFTGAQTMFHHNGLNGYYIYLNTEGLDVNVEHQLNMTFRLLDAAGNDCCPDRPTRLRSTPYNPTSLRLK